MKTTKDKILSIMCIAITLIGMITFSNLEVKASDNELERFDGSYLT